MHNDSEAVSAHEINQFLYCPYQWYYERYYGSKHIRTLYRERNEKLGYTDHTKSHFAKGINFHNHYLEHVHRRAVLAVIVRIILLAAVVCAVLYICVQKGVFTFA